MTQEKTKVVVVGAGFGGLEAVKILKNAEVDITIIDKNNHHLFQPLLYQIATSGLSPADIAVSIRSIFRKYKNVAVIQDEVIDINRARQWVRLHNRDVYYDYLIVAPGATHSYFGKNAWAELAPGLKTLSEAVEIRRRILYAFETAEKCVFDCNKKSIMTFVVIGGGPTGVELAGAIAELANMTFPKDFRNVDTKNAKVYLIEAGDRLLATLPEDLSAYAKRKLEQKGVEVLLQSRVSEITEDFVKTPTQTIFARTVIWAAGVKASPLGKCLDTPLDNGGRVIVERDLSVMGDKKVFVVGDLMHFEEKNGNSVPGVSPAAIQSGKHAAHNIIRQMKGLPTEEFNYFDKGTMATIGRAAAVAVTGKFKFTGLVAWLTWLLVHIFYLIGFANRFFVITKWAWAYYTYAQYSRLIIAPWTAWKDQIPDPQTQMFQGCKCKRDFTERGDISRSAS